VLAERLTCRDLATVKGLATPDDENTWLTYEQAL
jgi:hypothetical protein